MSLTRYKNRFDAMLAEASHGDRQKLLGKAIKYSISEIEDILDDPGLELTFSRLGGRQVFITDVKYTVDGKEYLAHIEQYEMALVIRLDFWVEGQSNRNRGSSILDGFEQHEINNYQVLYSKSKTTFTYPVNHASMDFDFHLAQLVIELS